MPLQKLYSVEEIAQMTSVTTRTIRNYLRNGILKGRKIGGQWRFSMEDIETMMNQTNGAFQENSRRIVRDFIDSVYTPFPQSISVCTIADVPCTQEKPRKSAKRSAPCGISRLHAARSAMTTLRTRRPPAIRSSRRLSLCRQRSPFFRRKPKRD